MEETPQTQNPAENIITPPVNLNGYGDTTLQPEQIQGLADQGTTPIEKGPMFVPDAMRSEARIPDVAQPEPQGPEIKFGADLPVGKVQAVKDAMVNQGQNESVSIQTEEPQPIKQGLGNSGRELIIGPDGDVKKDWNEPGDNPFFTDPQPPASS